MYKKLAYFVLIFSILDSILVNAAVYIGGPNDQCDQVGYWWPPPDIWDMCILEQNIMDTVIIDANNIRLWCGNHQIIGPGIDAMTAGISVSGKTGVGVQTYCNIKFFKYGIYAEDTTNSKFQDALLSYNEYGIFLGNSDNNEISWNLEITRNDVGIHVSGSENLIYNNNIGPNFIVNAEDFGNNNWNKAKTKETNIVGGPFIGGNYWSDYRGRDLNGDFLGDIPYIIGPGNNKDNLPLVMPSGPGCGSRNCLRL